MTCTRRKLDPYFIPHTKFNSKCIKNLNGRSEIIQLLEENIGENVPDSDFFGSETKNTGNKSKFQ